MSSRILLYSTLAQFTVQNQFKNNTTIKFSVPRSTKAVVLQLKIFDALGRPVKTLMNEMTTGGNYSVKWDGKDDNGRSLGSGYYIATLKAGGVIKMIKIRLIK